jgi:hypothetical protein
VPDTFGSSGVRSAAAVEPEQPATRAAVECSLGAYSVSPERE